MLGTTELLLLGGLALLIFGGKKVPEMMRGLGQGVKEFKKGMKEGEEILESEEESTLNNEQPEQNQPSEPHHANQNKPLDNAGE